MHDAPDTTTVLTAIAATTRRAARLARRGFRSRQRGFNFAEVLFAVMILGIGFIMIAALFPVALSQSKVTGEEVVASTVGRGGVNYFQQLGLTANGLPTTDLEVEVTNATPEKPNATAAFPPPTQTPPRPRKNIVAAAPDNVLRLPGMVLSFRDPRLSPVLRDTLWRRVAGNLILPDDPRTAWVGMYRRGVTYTNTTGAAAAPGDPGVLATPDPYATIIVVGVNNRNRSTYEAAKDTRRYTTAGVLADTPPATATLAEPATLEPEMVYVKTAEGVDQPDVLTFYNGPAGGATRYDPPTAAEGAYVIISDDQRIDLPATTSYEENPGTINAHIYRLAVKRDDLGVGTWELAPDGDMTFINPDGGAGNADDISENLPARSVTPFNPAPTGSPAVAFIVGRGWEDPTNPTIRTGPAQESGVYVSIVPAN